MFKFIESSKGSNLEKIIGAKQGSDWLLASILELFSVSSRSTLFRDSGIGAFPPRVARPLRGPERLLLLRVQDPALFILVTERGNISPRMTLDVLAC